MDRRALVVTVVILGIPAVLLVIWTLQGQSMEDDFTQALRSGTVAGVHRDLQNKQWSSHELATVEVLKIPADTGQERAISRAIHSRARIFLPSHLYEYQGTVLDRATDITHVFGYRRREPRHWTWARIHPDSMKAHLQRRMRQLEEQTEHALQE